MSAGDTSTSTSRLALGTAQLGTPYGIANRHGQPSDAEGRAMLDLAVRAGIRCFDTAAGYGEAEVRIGRYLREHSLQQRVSVITKLTVGDIGDEISLLAAVSQCAQRLGVAPAGVLVHDPDLLAHWRGPLANALTAARAEGMAKAIGVSVYHPKQFAAALDIPEIDIIQAPFNVFDRRLEQAGLLERAQERGTRVMLRSVFLQGLLLLDPDRCPPGLAFALPRLRRWHELCTRHHVDPVVAALRLVIQRSGLATIVVGCETHAQLRQLLVAASAPELSVDLLASLDELATADAALLDPTRWRT